MAALHHHAEESKLLRTVFLGKRGSGKSTTGNTIINQKKFYSIKSGLPCSKLCQQAITNISGQDIQIVITPGLFDTEKTDDETISEVIKCIDISSPGPHVFFMVLKIGVFTMEEKATVEHFRNVFGDKLFQYMVILFVGKDDLRYDELSLDQYINSVSSDLKTLLQKCKNRFVAFSNRASLAEREDDINHVIQVANTVVRDNRGGYYTREMYEQAKKNRQNDAKQEIKEAEIKAIFQKEVENKQDEQLAELEENTASFFPGQNGVEQKQDGTTYALVSKKVPLASTEMFTHRQEVDYAFKKATGVMQKNAHPSELRVVFLGKTGSGKSTTGNNILKKNQFYSSASGTSVSKLCQLNSSERFGQTIHIIDTPGMFDTGMTNEEITTEVVKCIGLSSPGPHVFFMVVRIGRFTPEEKATVDHFHMVFGDNMFRHLAVLFTGKDDLKYDEISIKEYVTQAPPELKKLLESCNNRFVAFDNRACDVEKNQDVQEFLFLSNKIVQENHGLCYTSEMFEAAEKIIRLREDELRKQYEAEQRAVEDAIKARVEKEMETEHSKKLSRLEANVLELEKEQSSAVTTNNKYETPQTSSHQTALIFGDQKYAPSEDPIKRQPPSAAGTQQQQPNFRRIAQEEIMQNTGSLIKQISEVLEAIGHGIVTLGNRVYTLIQGSRN